MPSTREINSKYAMRSLRQIFRLLYINIVLVHHGLEEVVFAIHLFRPVRFILYLLPWHWFRRVDISHGARVRRALEDLGPIFVKFGQALSTRRDLLPEDIADELAKLQDRVPPFSGVLAQQLIEKAYGCSLDRIFAEFNQTPLASASIAQVHEARLKNGASVVVKVLRPDIKKQIRRDLDLMHMIASLAHRYWPDARRLRPKEVVQEYEQIVLDELDLMREAANASQLRRNFENSPDLYIPDVYWPHCRTNVLVMEKIRGIPISDIDTLRDHGVNLKKLSDRGVHIFFTQVFKHNFFHADMHPGNIFVSYDHPEDPQYLGVDFGIVGTLSPNDQRYLAENFVAFFNRDYQRVAELHLESGWVPATTRVDQFESAIRTVCEPIFEKPLSQISFAHLLLRLFQTARRFNMEVQPQLVLLQKTLFNIEGLGRQLDPDLDLWQTAKPFLDQWTSEQMGVRAIIKGLRKNLPIVVERLPELPNLLYTSLKQLDENHAKIEKQHHALEELRLDMRRAYRKTITALIIIAIIVVMALWYFKP